MRLSAQNPTLEELDEIWRAALQDTEAPDMLVSLNARLQRELEEVKTTEGELRDWARMNFREMHKKICPHENFAIGCMHFTETE